MRHVVATAGHVDHGKSALIRVLTGTDPDRWEEEKRRGLTIDLGFASTVLGSGREVSFVDVPGHERFIGNMLAGLGPASAVCFVVAADQGWQAQSSDHRDAVAALGIREGVVVLTRMDLLEQSPGEDGGREPTRRLLGRIREELSGTGLADAPAVAVSSVEGTGLAELRSALDAVLSAAPPPDPEAPLRLWADRAFSVRGAGAVLTGTLAGGRLKREQQIELVGEHRSETVTVKGLQSHHQSVDSMEPACRAAVNLRGVPADQLGRGDALVTPGAWTLTATVDVRRSSGDGFAQAPQQLVVHIGTAAVAARCRPFDEEHARLVLARPVPLHVGDRLLLQTTESRAVLAGAQVLDVDPPALARRGDGRRRAQMLSTMSPAGEVATEVVRRGAVREAQVRRMGVGVPERLPRRILRVGDWLVDSSRLAAWCDQLRAGVAEHLDADPLSEGLSAGAAADRLGLPDQTLLSEVIRAAGLQHRGGRITTEASRDLGEAEQAVAALEEQLSREPLHAPESGRLAELGLGERELAAAERQGRLIRLGEGLVLPPAAPALAMRRLAELEQPFTASAARRALGVTRRTAIPLLEHLDSRGWTRRVDSHLREVVR